MSGGHSILPPGFEALEPFVESWAVAGTANRAHRRLVSSESDRVAFFTAARDMLAAALTYLDTKPLEQFDEKEQRLMNLMLSLCHVSLAVEMQRDDEEKHARARRHMKITRAAADRDPRSLRPQPHQTAANNSR
jgi:hypothetical protein